MVEFVGTLPLLVGALLICIQAGLLALTAVYAQGSADAAARGVNVRSLPEPSVWQSATTVTRSGGSVTVAVRAPSVLPWVGSLLPQMIARRPESSA